MNKSASSANNGARTASGSGGAGGVDNFAGGFGYGSNQDGVAEDLTRGGIDSVTEEDTDNLFASFGNNNKVDEEEFDLGNGDDGHKSSEDEVDEEDEIDEKDQSDNDDDLKDNQNNNNGTREEESIDDSEIIKPFLDLFHSELGWEVSDDEKPTTIDELVDYMKIIVDENAKENFASEEIAQLNEYIKNGGDIHSFYQNSYGSSDADPDRINISDVSNQRYVVASNLRNKGYSEDRIKRTITRFEDSGILEEEAEDAVVELKETIENNKRQLVEHQRQASEQQKAQEIEFFKSVQSEVSKVETIHGIPVTRQDRDKLLRYIFQRDKDGVTQYQRDYYNNLNKNLIESAYFTMKGESLVQGVQRRANTQAAQSLRDKLKSKSVTGKNSRQAEREDDQSVWESFSRGFKQK